jgi:hypothetical protein
MKRLQRHSPQQDSLLSKQQCNHPHAVVVDPTDREVRELEAMLAGCPNCSQWVPGDGGTVEQREHHSQRARLMRMPILPARSVLQRSGRIWCPFSEIRSMIPDNAQRRPGRPRNPGVRAVLKPIPTGCRLKVTLSGSKGWHDNKKPQMISCSDSGQARAILVESLGELRSVSRWEGL